MTNNLPTDAIHPKMSSMYLNKRYICTLQLEDRNGKAVQREGTYVRVTIKDAVEGVTPTASSSSSSALLCIPWLIDNCLSKRHSSGQRATTLYNERECPSFLPSCIDSCCLLNGAWDTRGKESPAHRRGKSIRMGDTSVTMHSNDNSSSTAVITGGGGGSGDNDRCLPLILHVVFGKVTTDGSAANIQEANIPIASIDKYVIMRQNNNNSSVVGHLGEPRTKALVSYDNIYKVDYSSIIEGKDKVYITMKHIAKDGLVLIKNCGNDNDVVKTLAETFGNGLMKSLYGHEWHVQSNPTYGPKNNVAYSTAPLDLHQDIPYYESMPGIQILHCQKFDSSVTGGMSTFLDSFLVAERFRAKYPKEFELLCKIPVAFMKDDLERDEPAQYYYSTPHFHVNDKGEVTKTFWSTAFEAPLPHCGEVAEEYYNAREKLCRVLKDTTEDSIVRFHLEEGDCVVFLQARMYHGRDGFTEMKPGSRILHGGYIHNEGFGSKLLAMAVREGDEKALLNGELCEMANRSYR